MIDAGQDVGSGRGKDEALEVDRALHTLAARGRAYELEVARWLLRAEALGVHRRFGFGSLAEYVERRLGLGRRELREKLRVARALTTLPRTTEALRRGDQSWSAVRELTRIVTPETEAEWLTHSRGRTVRQLERRVARHRPGDTPRTPRDEAHAPRRLVFEVVPEDLSKIRAALDVVWRGLAAGKSDKEKAETTQTELLVAMAEVVLGERSVDAPAYQTTVTVCAGCARTWQRAGGELVEVSDAVAGCARCDGEVIGFAEVSADDDPLAEGLASAAAAGRAPQTATCAREDGCGGGCRHEAVEAKATHVGRERDDVGPGGAATHVGRHDAGPEGGATHVGRDAIAQDYLRQLASGGGARSILRVMTRALGVPLRSLTPRLRRLVIARDGGRCIVPGCPHWRFIDVHHVVHRRDGGGNLLDNLACLCTAHHRAVHDGVLAIEGSATEGWVIRHAGGGEYGRVWAPGTRVSMEARGGQGRRRRRAEV